MKVQITHLKAPWPEGASVGDVVELHGPELPSWALGKCIPAAADAPVFSHANGAVTMGGGGGLDSAATDALASAEAQASAERQALESSAGNKPGKAKRATTAG